MHRLMQWLHQLMLFLEQQDKCNQKMLLKLCIGTATKRCNWIVRWLQDMLPRVAIFVLRLEMETGPLFIAKSYRAKSCYNRRLPAAFFLLSDHRKEEGSC